ncbi:MAG: 6-carboxytetrahydropterin synthase [Parvibaculum sp.]
MRIYKEFGFEAAHHLPSAPEGHPNSRIHGHSFRAVVWLEGEPDPETGLIRHFGSLLDVLNEVREQLDHHYLNEVPGLEVPTLENICVWIWNQLSPKLKRLARVEVHRDTCREGCVYDGPKKG